MFTNAITSFALRKKTKQEISFSNLREFISIVELALDRVFKGLCFRRRQFKHDQLKINMK